MNASSSTSAVAVQDAAGWRWAAAQSLEFMVPLALLGATPGSVVTFVISVSRLVGSSRVDVQRAPAARPISTPVPSLDPAILNWHA